MPLAPSYPHTKLPILRIPHTHAPDLLAIVVPHHTPLPPHASPHASSKGSYPYYPRPHHLPGNITSSDPAIAMGYR
ncbi:hypothetical protein EON63_24520 [archaeon]|nr:MAG: hypothetical protein EON63_24520 [archaeon]